MSTSNCPSCGKPNPDTVEICQYCGTVLKRSATEPLPPLHPGDIPVKRNTSDLERTLPGWLRDVRKASGEETSLSEAKPEGTPKPAQPVAPPEKPAPPKPKESASPLDFLAGLSQAKDDEEEVPDWLKSLQSSMPAPVEPVSPPEPQAEKPADWLAGLQSETQEKESPAASEPDWGFGDQPATYNFDENAEAAPQPPQDTPDWLAALKAQDEAISPAPKDLPRRAGQAAGGQIPGEDLPDWLASLSGTDSGAIPSQPAPVSRPMEQQPAPSDDTPDWLASLGGNAEIQPDQPSAESAPAAETSDWFAGLDESAGVQPDQPPAANVPAAETPDWLSSLGGGFNTEETPAAPETSQPPATETPDWLASLGGDSYQPVEPAPAEPVPSVSAPDADLPSWLSDLTGESQPAESQVTEPTSEKGIAPVESQPAESEVPAWMAGLQGSSFAPVESPAPQESGFAEVPPSAEDIPDWMASLQGEQSESQPAGVTEPAQPVESELPSWLAEAMGENPAEKPAEPASPSKPFDTGALRELGPLGASGELPDWMAKLGEPAATSEPAKTPESAPDQTWGSAGIPLGPETTAAGEEVSPAQPEPASFETPPAEAEAASVPSFSEEQNLDSILSLDMPDWLSGFTPTEAELSDTATAEASAEDDNLRPADLPSWVQAMRPVEDVMGEKIDNEEEEQQVESSGPLAGLRSVLPVQPGIPGVHKPKAYSIKLQVDETQRAQAALLENLLNSESTPQVILRKPEALVIRPLRWAIAAVLLVTVLLGAFLQDMVGSPVFPSPDLPAGQSEIGTFIKTIGNLPESATVLVVVDYQPGFAGEMEPAAGPVMRQLMSKNTRLAFVSTSPMGPYLADRLLQKYTAQYPYELGTQYVNLGYLPGGAGGIQVFAEQPATTIGQDWFQGNLWQKDALKAVTLNEVTKLSNFSAVIVLTDNPDTGRLWIEQAEPSLRPKPMLMVVSAQAQPMIRPYVVSGQLKGLVSGLEGGTLYESQLADPGQARLDWDAFGVAIFAAELLIIVGGVWGLVAGIRARRAEKMEQDEV